MLNIDANYHPHGFAKRCHLIAIMTSSVATKTANFAVHNSKQEFLQNVAVNYHSLIPDRVKDLINALSQLSHSELGLRPDEDPVVMNVY